MRPVRVTLVALGASAPIPLDHYRSPFSVSVNVLVSGTLTYSVEHTYDDVFSPGFNIASAQWLSPTALASKGVSAEGSYTAPVVAIRLNVTAFTSGSASMTVIQAGNPGR